MPRLLLLLGLLSLAPPALSDEAHWLLDLYGTDPQRSHEALEALASQRSLYALRYMVTDIRLRGDDAFGRSWNDGDEWAMTYDYERQWKYFEIPAMVDPLERYANDEDPLLGLWASFTLARFAPRKIFHLYALLLLRFDQSRSDTRNQLEVVALRRLRPWSATLIDPLLLITREDDVAPRSLFRACDYLGAIGPGASDGLPFVWSVAEGWHSFPPDPEDYRLRPSYLQATALAAGAEISPCSGMPVYVELLGRYELGTAMLMSCLRNIIKCGDASAAVASRLLSVARNSEAAHAWGREERAAALYALTAIGAGSDVFEEFLTDPSSAVRIEAALGVLGGGGGARTDEAMAIVKRATLWEYQQMPVRRYWGGSVRTADFAASVATLKKARSGAEAAERVSAVIHARSGSARVTAGQ